MDSILYMAKGLINNPSQRRGSHAMRLELVFRPPCFKRLDQISRAHYIDTATPDQLDSPCINPRHVRHSVQRRVLHGHVPCASQNLSQQATLLFPRDIAFSSPREWGKDVGLNSMDDFDRHALSWNPIVPASCDVNCRIEQQDAIGQGVAPTEIIKEPTIKRTGFAERLLNVQNPLVMRGRHRWLASYRRLSGPSIASWHEMIMLQCAP